MSYSLRALSFIRTACGNAAVAARVMQESKSLFGFERAIIYSRDGTTKNIVN